MNCIKYNNKNSVVNIQAALNMEKQLEDLFDKLWPICRSLAGPGYRESLDILRDCIPFNYIDFKSGEKVFDWVVPQEWHPHEAYLEGPDGRRYADFSKNNLHLLGYSESYNGRMPLKNLDAYLHSLPDMPEAIPYLTSYYNRNWGFCISHNERMEMPDGEYNIVVKTTLKDGFVRIGECILPGSEEKELFFTSYLCHPSLANNELSGPIALAALYQILSKRKNPRFTCRFIIAPETIGALCYLKSRGEYLKKHMLAGWVLTCTGDAGTPTYKQTKRGDALTDRATRAVLREYGPFKDVPFFPWGSDERQYASPYFDLPVGSLMRTMYGEYNEYHTSLDNKHMMSFSSLFEIVKIYANIVNAIENNYVWVRSNPKGEPFLSKYNLYNSIGSQKKSEKLTDALLWILNYSDGKHDLISIHEKSGLNFDVLIHAVALLAEKKLILSQSNN
jgi:aminopeptidase-like protein